MPDITVTKEGVEKLLKKINPSKACGPDMIPARILRDMVEEISQILTTLFQRTIDLGELPEDWKSANVSPIFRKGDRFKASNYRPVSLTSLCCKLQEHIITSNVLSHLEQHKILADFQHGLIAGRSCEIQLLTLVHELAETVDTGGQMDLVILDFSKAFGRVLHQRLLEKLNHYGIRGQTHGWIKVSKVAKIRNRYNQVPHLTQDTNGKVTNSQKTPQTRAKRSALSQQVTTKYI